LIPLADQAQTKFPIAAFSLGYAFHLPAILHLVPALGVVGDLNIVGAELGRVYDTRTPMGGMVFVQLRPQDLAMHGGHGMPTATMGAR
jgi:hypothetical protein